LPRVEPARGELLAELGAWQQEVCSLDCAQVCRQVFESHSIRPGAGGGLRVLDLTQARGTEPRAVVWIRLHRDLFRRAAVGGRA